MPITKGRLFDTYKELDIRHKLAEVFKQFIFAEKKPNVSLKERVRNTKVVEIFALPKKLNGISDDAIYVGENFAAVIDGVSSRSEVLSGMLTPGTTTGSTASAIIMETIKNFPHDIDKDKAIDTLTESISRFYKEHNFYEKAKHNPAERLAATAVIYSKHRGEIWMIGDCQCMVDDTLYTNTMLVDDTLTSMRAFVNEIELRNGKTVKQLLDDDIGKKIIEPFIKQQKVFENANFDSPFSYVDINGFPIDKSEVITVQIPQDAKYIVLASDGYPELKPTLEETEKTLKEIIEEDPLCIRRFKSTKGVNKEKGYISFDDRSYLRLALE